MLRPSPNHRTQRLPNDDDDDDFQQKAYGHYISASYPVPSRERGTVCGCSNGCRYPIFLFVTFPKMRRFIARLLRPSDYSFNTS